MSKNINLHDAKKNKNDEFYTQYEDIEKEVLHYFKYKKDVFSDKVILLPCDDPEWSNFTKFFAQNFKKFGLKELISTSYAVESKNYKHDYQPTLFETNDKKYNADKTKIKGKIFRLHRDKNQDGNIDINNLEWNGYLNGDGDFRSDEVKKLRDEADIIITNPPFSLFREFVAWIIEANKQFLIIGNMNAITYKEIFPYLKENKMWLGCNSVKEFKKPDGSSQLFGNVGWYANLNHSKRNEELKLMTMEANKKYDKVEYPKYDNYDAIEVSKVQYIPSDYEGVMGVPISFMDKYNPEQFEILGQTHSGDTSPEVERLRKNPKRRHRGILPGETKEKYARVLIKHKKPSMG